MVSFRDSENSKTCDDISHVLQDKEQKQSSLCLPALVLPDLANDFDSLVEIDVQDMVDECSVGNHKRFKSGSDNESNIVKNAISYSAIDRIDSQPMNTLSMQNMNSCDPVKYTNCFQSTISIATNPQSTSINLLSMAHNLPCLENNLFKIEKKMGYNFSCAENNFSGMADTADNDGLCKVNYSIGKNDDVCVLNEMLRHHNTNDFDSLVDGDDLLWLSGLS